MPEVVSDAAADRVLMFERWLRFEPVALAAAMLPLLPNQGLAPPLIFSLFFLLFHACGFARVNNFSCGAGGALSLASGGGARRRRETYLRVRRFFCDSLRVDGCAVAVEAPTFRRRRVRHLCWRDRNMYSTDVASRSKRF